MSTRTSGGESRLVLVRHGESVSNAERFVGGHLSCKGLTELGRNQVEALADRVAKTGEWGDAVALYSSVLARAVETAEIVAPSLGGLAVERLCSLCECHVGEADGLSWEEFDQRYGAMDGERDWARPLAPGGESPAELASRASSALVGLAESQPGALIVVATHGGVIGASMNAFLGVYEQGRRLPFQPENASITEWAYSGSGWRLVLYNDVAHLEADGLRSPRVSPPSNS